jgi:hypothetical protein
MKVMLEVSNFCLQDVKDGSAWKVWLEHNLILLNDELKTQTMVSIYFLKTDF